MIKILFIIDFPISNNLTGPALRYFELAKALSNKYSVTIAGTYIEKDFNLYIPSIEILKEPFFNIYNFGIKLTIPNKKLKKELNNYDLIITHGRVLRAFGKMENIKTPLLIDLYGPWFLEDIASNKKTDIKAIIELLKIGKFFMCSNERQKDLYLGMMLSSGIKNINMDETIGIVPVGIDSTPPVKQKEEIKGIINGIKETDKIVISWGGMWDFFDPETLIYAFKSIEDKRKNIKLIFFGTKRANADAKDPIKAKKCRELAKKLNLENTIFFIDKWIPYRERSNWLLSADLGVISHHKTIETRFSWRTRALDYLWANLPIITTEGDPISELVKEHNLGRTVSYNNPEAFANSILELLDNKEEYKKAKENIKKFKPNLYWENLIKPIDRFCENLNKNKSF